MVKIKKPKFHTVIQEDAKGCGVAALAMICGKTYKEVKYDFVTDFTKKGTPKEAALDYLTSQGWTTIELIPYAFFTPGQKLTALMLRPFADMHYVVARQYTDSPCTHAYVMTKKGTIYSTDTDGVHIIKSLSQIFEVVYVIGCFWHLK